MISKFSFSPNWTSAISLISLSLFLSCGEAPEEEDPSVNLLKGETLDGWTILGGDADYRVEDSVIIGTTVHNTLILSLQPIKNTVILFWNWIIK